MLQSWMETYDIARIRQQELLDEVRQDRIARAIRKGERAASSRRSKAKLCKGCPLRLVGGPEIAGLADELRMYRRRATGASLAGSP